MSEGVGKEGGEEGEGGREGKGRRRRKKEGAREWGRRGERVIK